MSVSSAHRANNLKFYRDPKYCGLKFSLGRDLKFYLSGLKAQIGPCSQRRDRSLKFYPDDLRRPLYGLKFHLARGLEFYLGGGLKFCLRRDAKFRRRGENFKFIQSAAEFYEKILKFRRATSAKDAKTAMKEPLCR